MSAQTPSRGVESEREEHPATEPVPEALDVWLYGTHVAELTRTSQGRMGLEWTAAALNRWGSGSRVVSNLLPMGEPPHAQRVKVFFDGYLPEGQFRVHHAVEAGVDPDDTYGLIATYGRDLAGALIIVAKGASDSPHDPRYEPITLSEVSQRLAKASRHTGRIDARDSFSSLPGMVPKVLLHREGGQWFACRGGAPSTWIVKRSHDADGPAADVVDTEVAALRCAMRLGFGDVDAEILHLDQMRAIAVARYDRRLGSDGNIGRIQQEDLAQATGLNTDDANRKYQRGSSRMPSLRHAAEVLTASSADPDTLLALVTFNFALGNTDMHAKNISFLRSPLGRAILAPAYDVSMHLHADGHNGQFALQINGKGYFEEITDEDLVAEGHSWGIPLRRARATVNAVLASLPGAIAAERATSSHPRVIPEAWDHVLGRLAALSSGERSTKL